MICQNNSSWECPMDHVEQNSKADELTRNRFVERAVEAYQASSQNTVEDVQANNQNVQRDHGQVATIQTGNDGQQSALVASQEPIPQKRKNSQFYFIL